MTVAVRPGEARVAPFVAQGRPAVERALAAAIGSLGPELRWVEHVTAQAVGVGGAGGGRRWRPLLVLAGAAALGRDPAAVMDLAVAVELTHTASLVLDDLPCMDDAAERRGQPAAHRMAGSAGAILVAIGLLGRAAELIGRDAQAGGVNAAAWGRAIGLAGMSGGQAVDVARSAALHGAARRLHREKTTALAAFALGASARALGAAPAAAAALEAYGRDLGWAYQLADDMDDAAEDAALGYGAAAGDAVRHCSRLLSRAERRLARTPGLDVAGTALLAGFGRAVVPVASPGAYAWGP